MILSSITQRTEKWDSLVLSKADFWMVWIYHGIPCFHIYFFCLEATVKRRLGWEQVSSRLLLLLWKCHSENYLISVIFKVLNNYEAHWQRHLKDTLQLKILQTRIDIRVNSFLDKYHETKMAKMHWTLLVAQKFEPVFEEHCTKKTFHSLLYSSFSLKRT